MHGKQQRLKLPKWSKWVLGIVGSLVLILSLLSWYLSAHYKPIVQEKLKEKIALSSKGLYKISVEDLDINLLAGSASLQGVRLTSDSTAFIRLKAAKEAPRIRFDLYLHHLHVQRLNLWKLFFGKKVLLARLEVDSMKIGIKCEQLPYAVPDTGSKDLYDKIKANFEELSVDEIALGKVEIAYAKEGDVKPWVIKEVNVSASDFKIDQYTYRDSTRVFYSKGMVLQLPRFSYDIPNSVYRMGFDQLRLDTKKKMAVLQKFNLVPRVAKEHYFKNDKQNKALIFIHMDTVRLEELDLAYLLNHQLLKAKKAFLIDGDATFRKDRRYQKDNVNKIGQAPHQQIMKMKQRIGIDTAWVRNVKVAYRQINDKGTDEGMITFQHARGTLTNITNDTSQLMHDKFMRADLRAEIMGQGLLHAVFGFDMLSKAGAHSYKGSLGKMQAPAFNPILTPLLDIQLAEGAIQEIHFDMQGNDYRNWGNFHFRYKDFKVNLLKGDAGDVARKKKNILSFLVNTFVINDSNPDANGVYHVGNVQHTRVPEYSHFKTIWKSIQDGIAQCAGINSKWLRESG